MNRSGGIRKQAIPNHSKIKTSKTQHNVFEIRILCCKFITHKLPAIIADPKNIDNECKYSIKI